MAWRWALAPLIVTAALHSCSRPAPITQSSATAFFDSIGVNTHLEYSDTAYGDLHRVESALRYLGLKHVRDAAFRDGVPSIPRYVALAKMGFRFDLFFSRNLQTQLELSHRLETAASGAIEFAEGPNEINNEGFGAYGSGDVDAARAYQRNLFLRVHSGAWVSPVAVLNYTDWPPSGGRADFANFHSYPWPATRLSQRLARDRDLAGAAMPARIPIICTESGFTTAGRHAVSQAAQAELMLRVLLENFRFRVKRTYLYELLDERPDAIESVEGENHFGLFAMNGSPKPAASMLRTLSSVLQVPYPNGSSSKVREPLQVSGSNYLILRRQDGSELIFLWRRSRGGRGVPVRIWAPWARLERLDLQTGSRTPVASGAESAVAVSDNGVTAFIALPQQS